METQIPDKELIERIVNKDSKALEILYDKYSPILYTLIKKIVVEKDKAETVLADVFVIVWQKSHLYNQSLSNFYTWLILLTRNKAIDFMKRENGLITDEYTDDYENEVIIPKISPAIDPLELDEAYDKRGIIYSAVNNLTEAQQYVLSLAYYDGLTESQIAEKLKIPLLTVKTKFRVVLNSIRATLTKESNK